MRPHSSVSSLFLSASLLSVFLLISCGGGNSPSNDSASDTGALSFKIAYQDPDSNLRLMEAPIDCADQGVATVEAKVYGQNNALLASGGPCNCDAGQGTIAAVPAGSGHTVEILGKNIDEKVIFNGRRSDIDVVVGRENNAGTIECIAFVPSLRAP
jgi:hypothetical protein